MLLVVVSGKEKKKHIKEQKFFFEDKLSGEESEEGKLNAASLSSVIKQSRGILGIERPDNKVDTKRNSQRL